MWCVRCRSDTVSKNEKQITTKNGKSAMSGICSECGTKQQKFISDKNNKKGGMYGQDNKREFNDDMAEIPKKRKIRLN